MELSTFQIISIIAGFITLVLVLVPAIVEIVRYCVIGFMMEEKITDPNPVHKVYFKYVLGCTFSTRKSSMNCYRDGKKFLSDETYYSPDEYYFHSLFYSAVIYAFMLLVAYVPLIPITIGCFIAFLFGGRQLCRIGKKVKAISTALENHKADKNAHGGGS